MKAALSTALVAITLAVPAQASYTFDREHQQLRSTVETLMSVTIDHHECFDADYAGWISGNGIVICGVNSPDHADFQDTLRHEGVHLAQRCKAYLSGVPGLVPLQQEFVNEGLQAFPHTLGQYPADQRDFEAEAWYVAGLNRPGLVNKMIRTHCSFAF